jgi:hypothetical protein
LNPHETLLVSCAFVALVSLNSVPLKLHVGKRTTRKGGGEKSSLKIPIEEEKEEKKKHHNRLFKKSSTPWTASTTEGSNNRAGSSAGGSNGGVGVGVDNGWGGVGGGLKTCAWTVLPSKRRSFMLWTHCSAWFPSKNLIMAVPSKDEWRGSCIEETGPCFSNSTRRSVCKKWSKLRLQWKALVPRGHSGILCPMKDLWGRRGSR